MSWIEIQTEVFDLTASRYKQWNIVRVSNFQEIFVDVFIRVLLVFIPIIHFKAKIQTETKNVNGKNQAPGNVIFWFLLFLCYYIMDPICSI